jgi:hypothetical protein
VSITEEVVPNRQIEPLPLQWVDFLVDDNILFPGGEFTLSKVNHWGADNLLQQGMDTLMQNLGIPATLMQCGGVTDEEAKLWPANRPTGENPSQ